MHSPWMVTNSQSPRVRIVWQGCLGTFAQKLYEMLPITQVRGFVIVVGIELGPYMVGLSPRSWDGWRRLRSWRCCRTLTLLGDHDFARSSIRNGEWHCPSFRSVLGFRTYLLWTLIERGLPRVLPTRRRGTLIAPAFWFPTEVTPPMFEQRESKSETSEPMINSTVPTARPLVMCCMRVGAVTTHSCCTTGVRVGTLDLFPIDVYVMVRTIRGCRWNRTRCCRRSSNAGRRCLGNRTDSCCAARRIERSRSRRGIDGCRCCCQHRRGDACRLGLVDKLDIRFLVVRIR